MKEFEEHFTFSYKMLGWLYAFEKTRNRRFTGYDVEANLIAYNVKEARARHGGGEGSGTGSGVENIATFGLERRGVDCSEWWERRGRGR